jgi:hypothetical protein
MEDGVGEDLSWFWRSWFYTTETLDQAVDSIKVVERQGAPQSRVYLQNVGPMVMPVDVTLYFEALFEQRGCRWRSGTGKGHILQWRISGWSGWSILRRCSRRERANNALPKPPDRRPSGDEVTKSSAGWRILREDESPATVDRGGVQPQARVRP